MYNGYVGSYEQPYKVPRQLNIYVNARAPEMEKNMAKVNLVKKARTHVKCDVCGKDLFGQSYLWLQFFRSSKQVRCSEHLFTRRETTRNEWQLFIYDLEDTNELSELVSMLEEKRDEQEDKLSNMEEYNLTGGSAYELIEERRDALEDAISIAEGADFTEKEDMTMDDIQNHVYTDYQSFLSEHDYEDDNEDKIEYIEEYKDEYSEEAFDDYVSNIKEEILGGL